MDELEAEVLHLRLKVGYRISKQVNISFMDTTGWGKLHSINNSFYNIYLFKYSKLGNLITKVLYVYVAFSGRIHIHVL